jgi:hypothetical protein
MIHPQNKESRSIERLFLFVLQGYSVYSYFIRLVDGIDDFTVV